MYCLTGSRFRVECFRILTCSMLSRGKETSASNCQPTQISDMWPSTTKWVASDILDILRWLYHEKVQNMLFFLHSELHEDVYIGCRVVYLKLGTLSDNILRKSGKLLTFVLNIFFPRSNHYDKILIFDTVIRQDKHKQFPKFKSNIFNGLFCRHVLISIP